METYLDNITYNCVSSFGTINKVCTWANGEHGTISINNNTAYFNGNIIAQGFIPYYIIHRKGRNTSTMFGINDESEEKNAKKLANEYYDLCLQEYKQMHEDDPESMLDDYEKKIENNFLAIHYEEEHKRIKNCTLFDYISEEETTIISNFATTYLLFLKKKRKKTTPPKTGTFDNCLISAKKDEERKRILKLLEGKTRGCDIASVFSLEWENGTISRKPRKAEYEDLIGEKMEKNKWEAIRKCIMEPKKKIEKL